MKYCPVLDYSDVNISNKIIYSHWPIMENLMENLELGPQKLHFKYLYFFFMCLYLEHFLCKRLLFYQSQQWSCKAWKASLWHPPQVHATRRRQFTAGLPEHREHCSCVWLRQHDVGVHIPCCLQASTLQVHPLNLILLILWWLFDISVILPFFMHDL